MGNFLVVVKALTYLLTLGREGIPEAAENAVLNANYLRRRIQGTFQPAFDRICMHEVRAGAGADSRRRDWRLGAGCGQGLIDRGIHPPTMYFPLRIGGGGGGPVVGHKHETRRGRRRIKGGTPPPDGPTRITASPPPAVEA